MNGIPVKTYLLIAGLGAGILSGCRPSRQEKESAGRALEVTAAASGWKIERLPDVWKFTGYAEDQDLSGIAVTPDFRHCLICTDEHASMQPGIMDKAARTVVAGAGFPLLRNSNDQTELDAEGVAWLPEDKSFYVTGSHGVGKKKGDFEVSRTVIVRIPTGPDGTPLQSGLQEGSLLPWVEKNAVLGSHVRQPLQLNGFNIEGLAAKNGKLWLGVRGPNINGSAYVIEAAPASLFTAAPEATLHTLAIGQGMGIRELVPVQDGFLVLTGNACAEASKKFPDSMARADDQHFRMFIWTPGKDPAVRFIGDVPAPSAKAEGMMVLAETAQSIDVLMLFDSAPGGGPAVYRIFRN